jgi:glycosyltransferase involved in cell wall biosynthesis
MLRRLNRASPIGVIASQSPFEDGWMALAFGRGRIPVVAQVHFDVLSDAALPTGARWRTTLGAARRRLAIRLLPNFAIVRAVAAEVGSRLAEFGANDVRVVPVPIFDLDRLRAVAALPRTEPRVLFVGRLAPEKNLHLWLEVARRVKLAVPSVRFDIVGDGPLRGQLEAKAKEMGLGNSLRFHGGKTRDELPILFGHASVFLLTSDHEGFGRVLVEAMAAGVGVVSTRTSGAREIVGNGDAALLADVGDANGLAAGVIALLIDDGLRARTIAAGPGVVGRYDPLRLATAWVDMLIEAAERRPLP